MELKSLTKEEISEAISEGVRRAFWDMIKNATDMPCHDFFDAVEKGVKDAHLKMGFQENAQAMATPLAGASVDRGIEAE